MSNLIDALNRLQSRQEQEQDISVVEAPPAQHEQPSPHDSVQVADAPDQMKPSETKFLTAVGTHEWVGILQKEYLHAFIREGGAAVKFGVCPGGDSILECQAQLEVMAREKEYVYAKVDSRFTKVHMVEKLFHKIAKQLDWDDLAYRFMLRLLQDNGYQIPSSRKEFSLRQIAALNERKEPMLRRDVQTWLEKTIEGDSGLCREFRMAMIRLCVAQLDAGDTDQVLGTAVKEWLCGDLRLVSGVKKALIYQKVARHNARYMLSSLTRWLRLSGYGGLVVTVDISQYFRKRNPSAQGGELVFSPSATMDLYELLRQFLDASDDIEGLLMVVLSPQDFLSDVRRGVDRYEPLKLRVWDDIRPKHRQNPLSSLVRIGPTMQQESVSEPVTALTAAMPIIPDLEARRVIEGLRAGVPNRHVVNALGCLQPEIEGRFRRLLEATQNNVTAGTCPRGMVIDGEFGAGKSHVLEYLQNLALESNFICSRIVISKETPLYHPVRLYYSAIESAVIPNKRGEVFAEIASECDVWTPRYKDLVNWVNNPENGIDARFAATLFLYERMSSDMELGHRMARFWTGDPVNVGDLKRFLHEAGFAGKYAFGKASVTQLALQRFQFAARLMQAAGYSGWILLIDEVELVGRYSVNQRAKSYGEVARLMQMDGGPSLPGLGTVLALTNDFRSEVLEKKGDKTKLVEKLRAKGTEQDIQLAAKAELGMKLLETQRIPIGQPPVDVIEDVHRTVRTLHLKGHGWRMWEQATDAPATILPDASMRKYVKSWVTQWDFHRLFPNEECELESANWKFTYEETHSKDSDALKVTRQLLPLDSVSQEAELVAQVFPVNPILPPPPQIN
ncbi:MAG: BREX system ATP-binding domain-containing protein [Nitrospirales bacterium]